MKHGRKLPALGLSGAADEPGARAGGWYSDAVVRAPQNEYINGYGDGRFGTNAPSWCGFMEAASPPAEPVRPPGPARLWWEVSALRHGMKAVALRRRYFPAQPG